MTEKDMKKLTRYQLLELLIAQSTRVEELQTQLEQTQAKLDSRDIQMTVIGSIAEASLQLSGVMEAAQKAADLYLAAVQDRIAAMEADAAKKAEQMLQEAQKQARQILREAEEAARQRNLSDGMNDL